MRIVSCLDLPRPLAHLSLSTSVHVRSLAGEVTAFKNVLKKLCTNCEYRHRCVCVHESSNVGKGTCDKDQNSYVLKDISLSSLTV